MVGMCQEGGLRPSEVTPPLDRPWRLVRDRPGRLAEDAPLDAGDRAAADQPFEHGPAQSGVA
jgi:hypothetical protein